MGYFIKIALIGIMLLTGYAPAALAAPGKEAKVKAAILYNLARFSTWPAHEPSRDTEMFTICATPNDPMMSALETLDGKTISGRIVETKPYSRSKDKVTDCKIFFFSKDREQGFDLTVLADNGVLTVGDTDGFLPAGGGISILRAENKIGFSINNTALAKGGIRPSSKVLRLAREVR